MTKKKSIEVAKINERRELRKKIENLLSELDCICDWRAYKKVAARIKELGAKNGLGENIESIRASVWNIGF